MLFCTALALYLTGCKKNYSKITRYSKPLICPLLMATAVLAAAKLLPDSKNIIKIFVLVLSLCTAGTIFFSYPEKRLFSFLGQTAFILSCIVWTGFLYPSLFLYPLKAWIIIVYAVLCTAAAAGFSIFFIRKNNPYFSIMTVSSAIIIAALNFFSLITLTGSFHIHSVVFTAGTILFFCTAFITAKQTASADKKNQQFIMMLSFIISELLMCTGTILMIAL